MFCLTLPCTCTCRLRKHKQLFETDSTVLAAGSRLPPPVMRGDWQALSLQIGFKAQSGEIKAAAKMLYELLMVNSDILDVPPDEVPNPDLCGSQDRLVLVSVWQVDLSGAGVHRWWLPVGQYGTGVCWSTATSWTCPPTTPTYAAAGAGECMAGGACAQLVLVSGEEGARMQPK